jgi:hypothetical protein
LKEYIISNDLARGYEIDGRVSCGDDPLGSVLGDSNFELGDVP